MIDVYSVHITNQQYAALWFKHVSYLAYARQFNSGMLSCIMYINSMLCNNFLSKYAVGPK